ncbi:putative disease resistance RPP13-like protein 1 isoform X1 [Arachis hypogaea]|uniref:putative disease resistance RPP13-like protein 1 isoform X1 n=1 Tax=Arachis hypogaea TaxID=3818 RepID=UPI0010FC5900|nr:putative disease resistance RPP13-like protein 1 [Arachis hypogaea]QHO51843.1 Putative disease resistance RPP13-like protein [Arachis hypogaea]
MAGSLVGGAFLSGFINVVFDRLLTKDAVNLVLGKKLDPDLVKRLKISLHAAEAVLDDAEYKQLGNESVREWLNDLRDAVYEADDLLDAVLTKEAIQKEGSSYWPDYFLNREREMVDEMERVVTKIEFLEQQKDFLGLQITMDNNILSSSWRESTSLVEGNIYGREDDQQALLKVINDSSESELSVIPIVGMGGVGKTTLAKWVYNTTEGFDLKAWVCISETFDVVEITRKTIEEITKTTCTLGSLNLLQNKLLEILSGKKFFVVLDDVWSDDADNWKKFKTPFHCGGKGSTILLTTRIKQVASVVQTCSSYFLNELSEDSCWLLFAENACFPESNGNQTLEDIGRQIVNKCKGLPLAVETLGRLLQGKDDAKEWNAVLSSDIWEFPMKNSKIIPALLISYFQLPAYLKRCFVYCSLYPKDYLFEKDELILLWMAEDLLRPPTRGESLKEVGCKCFEELISRLFFKQDLYSYYKMHDLLHDLAIFLAGDFYCSLEEHDKAKDVTTLTRHLSYEDLNHVLSQNFDSITKVKSLRTFLPGSFNIYSLFNEVDGDTINILIKKFKYLRVLSFDSFKNLDFFSFGSFSKLDVLLDSIGELIHLRYLNLSWTDITTLPESLCNLHNLQTLILYECTRLTKLPSGMHSLVNLEHLDLRRTCLEEMPGGIGKLKHLPILDYFVVGRHEDNGIQELAGLSNLHGSFEIKKLENVVDARQARGARMLEKNQINNLLLEWCSDDEMVPNTETLTDILDGLQPQNGLKELKIKGYKGTIFPDWLGGCSYNNMTSVSLESCKNCCMLPSLGQLPSLKSLRIEGFDQLKRIGDEFYKNERDHHSLPTAPFPSLETLEFHNIPCLQEWHVIDPEAFPQLKRLRIKDCPMLKEDMLNGIFLRMVSSSSDSSKVLKLEIRGDHEKRSNEILPRGDALSIRGCESLVKSAFNARSINHLCCLQEVHIYYCLSAVSFPDNCLPKSLQKLTIYWCPKFEFPEQQQHKYDLVELQIEASCDSLTSFSLDAFSNLKNLEIRECRNLESVSMSEAPHAALQRLIISGCSKLVSLAGEGLAAPNLTHLQVTGCENLEALPRDMKSLLPSLQSLQIYGCPNICRLAEGDLPPNLKSLGVGGCEEQMRILSWMGNLDTLTHLTISGSGCVSTIKSYPEVDSLPHLPSLTTLHINNFDNLETLECNELLRLTSLQQLHIEYCYKLENMEGETLPSSLILLQIEGCHLLEEHCKNKHQLIWPKISHIPTIKVTDKQIF